MRKLYLLTIILPLVSCQTHFRAISYTKDNVKEFPIDSADVIYVHQGKMIYQFDSIEHDSSNVIGVVKELKIRNRYHSRRKTSYRKGEKSILNEIHIYVSRDSTTLKLGKQLIPLSHIGEVKVIDKNKNKTFWSYSAFPLGLGAATTLGVLIFIANFNIPYSF
jgi:hypothetical protein